MTSSSRTLPLLTGALLGAAVVLSTIGVGAPAMATTPIPPIPPSATIAPITPTKLHIPQLKLTLNYDQPETSTTEWWTAYAKYTDGGALSGTLQVVRDMRDGVTPLQVLYTSTSTGLFVGGVGEPIPPAPLGSNPIISLNFFPTGGGSPSTADAIYQVRLGGGSVSTTTSGSLVSGSPIPVTAVVSVPAAEAAGHPLAGRVGLQIDSLGEKASCLPAVLTATTVSCTALLPASLAAGTHTMTAVWTQSPFFQNASHAVTLVIVAPKAAPKGSSSKPAPKSAQTASSSSSATATPEPSATAAALPGAIDPGVPAPQTTSVASTVPLWLVLVLVIGAFAVLGAAALLVLGIVRSRRGRTA